MREIFWCQKAQNTWLQQGDANKGYFNRSTILRRRHNRIHFLNRTQGDHTENPEVIKILLMQHFPSRWMRDRVIQNLDWPIIDT